MIKNKKILFIIILAVVALTLGACTGRRVVATGWSGITVNEETVYFSYGPHTYALNLKNGAQQWQFPVEPINGVDFYAAPVLADDHSQLLVAGYDSVLYSVNPVNGSENWSFVAG